MRIFTWVFLALSFALFSPEAKAEQYTCPMHPHYISEEHGNCPICGMELVALEAEESTEMSVPKGKSSGEKEILYWVAPMDPNFKSDKPGKSPMGMDLVPVYDEGEEDNEEGRAVVRIAPETIQNMGVRKEKAQIIAFGKDIRSYGLVTENVRLKNDISSRISGWVEELKITAVGDTVKEGDLLFSLYSPELVSAQQDYLAALSAGVKGRISSSAKRLVSLGVQQKFINQLKKKRRKSQNVPFYAETNGIVSELMVNQGSYVKPGMHIAAVQNYSAVWINVSVAEKDLQFLSPKGKASVVLPNLGHVTRTAHIDYIYPTLDTASRTGQVRLVLDNTDGDLKPGAYADVTFETNIDKRLSVPSEAILKSSEGDFVVVALGEGRFQPRRVVIGVRSKGRTEVLSGLVEKDDVVVSSQFLIDSESALRESFRKFKKKPVDGGEHANH